MVIGGCNAVDRQLALVIADVPLANEQLDKVKQLVGLVWFNVYYQIDVLLHVSADVVASVSATSQDSKRLRGIARSLRRDVHPAGRQRTLDLVEPPGQSF
jgi:hypothetical protein